MITGAYRVSREHRPAIEALVEQTGQPVCCVVNQLLEYALSRVEVKPVTRMSLVFDEKEGEEA